MFPICFMMHLTVEWHYYTAILSMFYVCCEMGLFRTVRSVWFGLLSNSPVSSAGESIFTSTEPCESVQGVLWQKNHFALTFYLHQMFTFQLHVESLLVFPIVIDDKFATSYSVKGFVAPDVVVIRKDSYENSSHQWKNTFRVKNVNKCE